GGLLAALRRWFSGPFVGGVGVALAALLLIWGLSLTRQLDRADAQLQAQAARLDGLALQLDDVADNNTTLQAEVTALAAERDAVAAELAALRRESGALETQLAALEQQNATLLASNAGLAQDAAQAQDVMTLLTAGSVAQVALPGTAEQPAAQGRLLFQPESQVALLMVEDLPALNSGQVYQVLLIRDDGHDTAETFSVDFNGQNVVLVHAQAPLETFTAVGVSIEPTGGSPQRTGEIVLLGELLES
ncbi:MAG: anti-sigma factor, partial [Anaerolineales bacterium]|nr:anti-sigma factor [Anaerolineales bacterium]